MKGLEMVAHDAHGLNAEALTANAFGLCIQILGILILFMAFAYAYKYLKKWNAPSRKNRKSVHQLNVLESKSLGNRQFLLVVAHENEKILLGVYPNGIQFLCKLSNTPVTLVKSEAEKK